MRSKGLRRTLTLAVVMTLAACSGPGQSSSAPESGQTTNAVGTSTAPSTTVKSSPATTSTTTSAAAQPLQLSGAIGKELRPGSYLLDHDQNPATSLEIAFTLTEPGWHQFAGVYKHGPVSPGYVAVKFIEVDRVAAPACDATVFVPVEQTAEAVAMSLGGIEDFITQTPPTKVTAFGYDGYHLVLQVPDLGSDVWEEACDDSFFDGYEGPGIGRYYQGPEQFVEFWVLDIEGTPLVIESTWFPDSPAEDRAQLAAILDTAVITP